MRVLTLPFMIGPKLRSVVGLGLRAWRLVRAFLRKAAPRDPNRIKRRMQVEAAWAEPIDGAAPRLTPQQTIEVTRHGRFREIDPRQTVEGWRDPFKTVGFLLWAAAVGVGWWAGTSRGRGPMKSLAEHHDFGQLWHQS